MMNRRPQISTHTYTLFPYTTLFRATIGAAHQAYIARDTEIGRGPGNAKIAGPFRFQTHSRDIDLIVCADRDIEIPGNGHATPGLRIARYDFPHGRSFAANAG